MLRLLMLLIIGAGLAASPARAAEETFEGTVGSAAVVMALTDGTLGQYFYRNVRVDIELSGDRRGQTLELESRLTGDRLKLSRAGTGLSGVLVTKTGRQFPVSLHRAAEPRATADLPAGLSLYERLQLSGLTLSPERLQTVNGKTIRWYRNGLTGIRLFRLESGYATPAMAAMNHALTRHQWKEVLAWLQCPGEDGSGSGAEASEADKPGLGPIYVSYLWRSSWSCAGTAHPDFGVEGHSFDARTGRELKLDEVLPVGPGRPPAEDSQPWYGYRSETFAPAVVALLKRYHRAQMARPNDDDGCDYTDPEVWSFPSWVLREDGLWLGAVFPRVARACDSPDWAVIPWSALPARANPAR